MAYNPQDGYGQPDISINGIILAHEHTYPPGYVYRNYEYGRQCHGMVYAVSGKAVYTTSEGVLAVGAGDCAFLPASSAYTVKNASDEPFRHYTVNFTLEEEGSEQGILTDGDNIRVAHLGSLAMKKLFDKASGAWFSKKSGYKILTKACLYEIIFHFLTAVTDNADKNADLERISPAMDYIEARYDKSIALEELSELCELSTTHLRRLFKRSCGCTPLDYQLSLRISRAQDLLSCRLYSVKEIAYMTGFSDPNYFGKYFKKVTGQSPCDYKRMN
ncbi:MAG: helix-turn-helix domain-containing protein [Eubacteriales bacterium]